MPELTIPDAEFITSSPSLSAAPRLPLTEIAFAGRSNVGKSSLINSLLNRKQLAMTSRTPGKTRLLNYYRIGKDLCYFVDLPGYGFAKVSASTKEKWGQALEEYIGKAVRLRLVVLVLDMRQGLMPLDEQMADALAIYKRDWIAVLTKSDKLGQSEHVKAFAKWKTALGVHGAREIISYSAATHRGRSELWQAIRSALYP